MLELYCGGILLRLAYSVCVEETAVVEDLKQIGSYVDPLDAPSDCVKPGDVGRWGSLSYYVEEGVSAVVMTPIMKSHFCLPCWCMRYTQPAILMI
jgi:hypothetical protein